MNALLFAPELVLIIGGLVVFGLSMVTAPPGAVRKVTLALALCNIAACVIALPQQGSLFYDAYRVDLFSQIVKLALATGFGVVLLFGTDLKDVAEDIRPEYYFFLITSMLGLNLLASSVELLTLFLSLELSSYSLYLLVPMRDERGGLREQMEAAVKYILFGVVATGIMLFGMSYVFGLTGTTYLYKLLPAMHAVMGQPVAWVALIMMLCGFLFKLAVFPFHFWSPDVYQGASNDTTAFIASIPKVAAVAILARFCALSTPETQAVITTLTALSIASMFYGNLVALVQTDIKRMLGFSGIAHAGYILLGFVTMQALGFATALYYVAGYLVMMLAAFLVICTVSPTGANVTIKDLNGLHKRSPLLAFTLAVSMFALAGIPPFVGFMGKFMLLTGAYKAGHLMLVIMAAINTAISIYYYLQVVRAIYTVPPQSEASIGLEPGVQVASVFLLAAIIALGLAPEAIVQMTSTAVKAIM
ncbi:NADH-quinone oxidoreductase subunit N [Fundidesulfovibrio soli]|uniref:NADH-quinone oxidoreductase subunit N n=1 Tax=Fundidesulfovibrio soli TaxID=2922716 RepID=UPI001FB01089|nr:NADH-quinone oxidoreductase subunit N [Fundidesulfovibrio soli]